MNSTSSFSSLRLSSLFSFSKEDTSILKGYGILFMIFHHVFGLYALPQGIDTSWIHPWLTFIAPKGKICVCLFIFITGYAMGIKMNTTTSFLSLTKAGFLHYFKFWRVYFLCLILVISISWAFSLSMLIPNQTITWKGMILIFTGLRPCYPDWWYMILFAVSSVAVYPFCAWLTRTTTPCFTMCTLLVVSIILQKATFFPLIRDNIHFISYFIFGYMYSILTTKLPNLPRSDIWKILLILFLEILSILFLETEKSHIILVLFSIWCLPWITKKLRLTSLLTLLGTYSALMWLNHRFIFGYYFCWSLYATHNATLIFSITLIGSLLLAMIMQRLFSLVLHRPKH